MKKFTQYLSAQGLGEALDNRTVFETPLVEAKLSRVFQYVEDDSKTFGIVSAFRGANSDKENKARHEELKKTVRSMGYGYIEMRGGYKGDEGYVEELSLLIPKVAKKEIVALGRKFEQHSVMFKDKQDFYYIGTNEEAGIGKVLQRFKKGAGQDNLSLAKHKVIDFFSKLKKGSHRDTKFVFNAQEEPPQQGGGAQQSGGGESAAAAQRHKPGQVWKTSSGLWGAMDKEGNYEYFEDQEKAQKYAKAHRKGMKIQEREEWNFAKAAYLRRGDSPKWITIYEDFPAENE
jgi:hypothetical protein